MPTRASGQDHWEEIFEDVVVEAQAEGYLLMQRELDTGELAWVWRQGIGSAHPCFLTRRQALEYMEQRLRVLRSPEGF